MARPGLTDLQVLEALHLRDVCGLTPSRVAAQLGVGHGVISGALWRVDREADAEEARALCPGEVGFGQGPVARAANMDGAMGARWWACAAPLRLSVKGGRA